MPFPVTLTQPTSGAVTADVAENGKIITVKLNLANYLLPVTDAAGSGSHGSTVLLTFPEDCKITASNLNLALVSDGTGVPNDAVLEIGVGTTGISAAADGVLGATEDDIATDINVTLSSGAGTAAAITHQEDVIDISADDEIHLNVSGTAATVDANGSLTVTGTAIFHIEKMGA